MNERHVQWVNDTQKVRGFYKGDMSETRFVGKVVAYQPQPSVMVMTEDGRQEWWPAHLCEPVPEPAPRPCGLCDDSIPAAESNSGDLCSDHRAKFEAWMRAEGILS